MRAGAPAAGDLLPGEELERWVDAPTVQVTLRRLPDGTEAVAKRYFFPRLSQRLRGAARHTWRRPCKAEREALNLGRLAAAGVPTPPLLGWDVVRDRAGFVRDSYLATQRMAGSADLQAKLLSGWTAPGDFWPAVGASVRAIHEAGCWYRKLVPRNLLVREGERGIELSWIDPSSSRWPRGGPGDGERRVDLAVFLLPPLRAGALSAEELRSTLLGYGMAPPPGPQELTAALPARLRRMLRGVLAREAARWA